VLEGKGKKGEKRKRERGRRKKDKKLKGLNWDLNPGPLTFKETPKARTTTKSIIARVQVLSDVTYFCH